MKKWKSAALASAVAGMFIAGTAHHAVAAEEGTEAKVKCEGVNACKGKSDCKTATSECSGHNACKGKGHLDLTQKECDEMKAKMDAEKKS